MVTAAPTTARADEVTVSDKARELFGQGVDLLEHADGPKYREAYRAFQDAYADSPSPKILGNLGLCAMNLERDGEAIAAYERYLQEVPDADFQERQRINKDLETLRGRSATLTLDITPAGAQVVDKSTSEAGNALENEYQAQGSALKVGVRNGKHSLEIKAKGYETGTLEIEILAGEEVQRKVKLEKPPPPPPPPPTPTPVPVDGGDMGAGDGTESGGGGLSSMPLPVLIGAGVTGLALVGFAVVGGLALKAKADYTGFESGGDREDAEATRARGQTLNHAATGLLVATAAFGAATLIMYFVLPKGDDDATATTLTVQPMVGLDGGGASVGVHF
jgi:hypothetical protein